MKILNSLGIGERYVRFFVKNLKSRWVLLQGGRRSGKSFAIHRWIWLLASCSPKTIMCVAATYPALRSMIDDFQRASGLKVNGSTLYGYTCTLSNGSRYLFRSFDSAEKAQGTTANILFIEEGLNVPGDIVNTLAMSITDQIYVAFNPTRQTGVGVLNHIEDGNLLKTTFKDNPFLPEAQVQEFEEIRKRAEKPGASIIDQYFYLVYYKGEFADATGKVFSMIYTCDDEEFERIPVKSVWGLDFGFVDSGDQTALVEIKVWQNNLYCKEVLFSNTELQNNKDLAMAMAREGITVYDNVFADYAGLGRQRIKALVTAGDGEWVEPGINAGFNIINAKKGRIIDGLSRMLQFEKIFVTESSMNLRREMENYELGPGGKPRGEDHLVDACRYAANSWSLVAE